MLGYLPGDYESAAKACGAMQRMRQIKSSGDLMLLCLNYLLKGLTLVEVSVFAAALNIANISNGDFMKRFVKCGGWFNYIAKNLQYSGKAGYEKPSAFDAFTFIL